MTQEVSPEEVGLGLCLKDRNVFVYSSDYAICIMCGRQPDYIIPVTGGSSGDDQVVASPPAVAPDPALATRIGVTCPHCQQSLTLEITSDAVTVIPPADPDTYATQAEVAVAEQYDAQEEEVRQDVTAPQVAQ